MATAVVPPLSLPACADASSGTAQSLVSEVAGAVEREEEREAREDAAGAAALAAGCCRCLYICAGAVVLRLALRCCGASSIGKRSQ